MGLSLSPLPIPHFPLQTHSNDGKTSYCGSMSPIDEQQAPRMMMEEEVMHVYDIP